MDISTTMKAMSLIAAATFTFVAAGCSNDGEADASTESTAAPAEKPANKPPADKPAKAPPAGDVTAGKVQKPLADWQSDDVKATLEKSGWKITGATQTKSSMLSIVVSATKGETKAKINYYKNGGSFWKKRLVKDKAATYEEGDVIVGVVVEGNEEASKKLLNSLLGK